MKARNPPQRSKKTLKDKVVLFVITLGIILGLVFFFNRQISQWIVEWRGNSYTNQTAQQMKDNKNKGLFDSDSVKALTVLELMQAQLKSQSLPVIGLMAIPDLKMNLPIFAGDGYTTMMYGGGTMKPNQKMGQGNYSLASHTIFDAYGNAIPELLFGNLIDAQIGQKVYITDKLKVYIYGINRINQVDQSQGKVIQDNKGQKELTLITCVGLEHPQRWVIHGKFIQEESFNEQTARVFKQKFSQGF